MDMEKAESEPAKKVVYLDVGWRDIWFKTGGYDIFGDATETELAFAEHAREFPIEDTEDDDIE